MSLECCVCFENDWVSKTPCKHLICIKCLLKLKKDECPMCRRELFSKLPMSIKNLISITKEPIREISNIIDTTDSLIYNQ